MRWQRPPGRSGSRLPAWSRGSASGPSCGGWPPSWGSTVRVGNDTSRVFVEAAGPAGALDELARRLSTDAPPLARIDAVRRCALPAAGSDAGARVGVPHRRQRSRWGAHHGGAARHRGVRRLPGRAVRPGRPPPPPPVHHLHQLRAPVHHHHRPALRPAGHHHGRLPDVPGLRRRVRRSGRPPLPRPAHRLPPVRPDAALRPNRATFWSSRRRIVARFVGGRRGRRRRRHRRRPGRRWRPGPSWR